MNDPLAYFLTWHTYGSWLQGDSQGSVDRTHREYGRVFVPPHPEREATHRERMRSDTFTLNEQMRIIVQTAVMETCRHRGWKLLALHVRTTHVHAVVAADVAPERVLNDFKSYATRGLRRNDLIDRGARVWSRHGSTRYLWKHDGGTAAIDYVANRQGILLSPKPLSVRDV